jgi:hypothetical protein
MFLKTLNEEEKKDFLELAVRLSISDNDFADSEKEMIEEYKYEMNVEFDEKSVRLNKDISELISSFSDTDNDKLNMIFIELMALGMADEKMEISEKNILSQFMKQYGLTQDYWEKVESWLQKLSSVYSEGLELINN